MAQILFGGLGLSKAFEFIEIQSLETTLTFSLFGLHRIVLGVGEQLPDAGKITQHSWNSCGIFRHEKEFWSAKIKSRTLPFRRSVKRPLKTPADSIS